MAYPTIPAEITSELDSRRRWAAEAFEQREWVSAADRLNDVYQFLLDQQERYGTRFHKGWELHNGGVALLQSGQVALGLRRILLAYAEDSVSADLGAEDAVDQGLAGNVLRQYRTSGSLLSTIRSAIRREKEAGQFPRNPDQIVDEASQPGWAEVEIVTVQEAMEQLAQEAETREEARTRTIENDLDLLFKRRCFVGGNYFDQWPTLQEIKRIVGEEGFDPIFAGEFDIPASLIHHHSLMLLHLCYKAIFEVSGPAGQLIELEKCRDYEIGPLVVRSTKQGYDPTVSKMVSTMGGVEVLGYSTMGELRELILKYLRT